MEIVRQRSHGDCLLASLATVLGRSYEQTASLLGVALNERGVPVEIDKLGIALSEVVVPLLREGLLPVTLISSLGLTRHPVRKMMHVSPASLAEIIKGHRGVVTTEVIYEGKRYGHAMAWDGNKAFDCEGQFARETSPFVEALILFNADDSGA